MTLQRLLLAGLAAATLPGCGGGDQSNTANQAAPGETVNSADRAADAVSIGDALGSNPDHRMLLDMIQSAGLVELLRSPVPYTLFAPTDAAFAALPEEARQRLRAPEQRERLVNLLSFHIVPGTVTAPDLNRAIDRGAGGRAELATVTGDNLSLSREGGTIMIGDGSQNRARLVGPERIQSNGVIHSIDAVLMPAD